MTLGASLALAMVAGGCAQFRWPAGERQVVPAGTEGSRAVRERLLSRTWTGHTRSELVRVWGEPRLVMYSPGFNEHRDALILVFFDRDPEGGCIDAFVVWRDADETVSTYFCR